MAQQTSLSFFSLGVTFQTAVTDELRESNKKKNNIRIIAGMRCAPWPAEPEARGLLHISDAPLHRCVWRLSLLFEEG